MNRKQVFAVSQIPLQGAFDDEVVVTLIWPMGFETAEAAMKAAQADIDKFVEEAGVKDPEGNTPPPLNWYGFKCEGQPDRMLAQFGQWFIITITPVAVPEERRIQLLN